MIFAIAAAICCLGLGAWVAYYYPEGNVSVSDDAGKPANAKPAAKEPERHRSWKLSEADRAEGLKLLEEARALEFGLDGTAMDCAKAFALYAQAAKLGSAEAWYRMGCLALGRKVAGIIPKNAVDFFQKAADMGYVDAYVALAKAYIEGRLAKTDLAKADFYLDLAVDAGNTEAKFLKGALLAGSTETSQEGLNLLMDAAKAGNADAQYTLANLYREGKVVARDRLEGDKWLRLAAEGGSAAAKAELGMSLLKSGGIESSGEAAALLMEAAEAGNSRTAYNLAKLFFGGKPSAEALRGIRDYAEKAFDGGMEDGAFLIALSYAVGKNPNLDQALQWLETGKVEQDWRSWHALQLIQNGTATVEAFKIVSKANYDDWVASFDFGKTTPENITPPKFINMTVPKIPDSLSGLNINGNVDVEFIVGENGVPRQIQVNNDPHPDLSNAVLAAMQTWRLTPALKDGQYVPLKIKFPVRAR